MAPGSLPADHMGGSPDTRTSPPDAGTSGVSLSFSLSPSPADVSAARRPTPGSGAGVVSLPLSPADVSTTPGSVPAACTSPPEAGMNGPATQSQGQGGRRRRGRRRRKEERRRQEVSPSLSLPLAQADAGVTQSDRPATQSQGRGGRRRRRRRRRTEERRRQEVSPSLSLSHFLRQMLRCLGTRRCRPPQPWILRRTFLGARPPSLAGWPHSKVDDDAEEGADKEDVMRRSLVAVLMTTWIRPRLPRARAEPLVTAWVGPRLERALDRDAVGQIKEDAMKRREEQRQRRPRFRPVAVLMTVRICPRPPRSLDPRLPRAFSRGRATGSPSHSRKSQTR